MSIEELRQHTEEFNEYIDAFAPPTPEQVGEFFDRNHDVLVGIHHGNMHHGYWTGPDDDSDFAQAAIRATDVVIHRLGAGPGDRVLDIGCGVGQPALRLAQATGADVVGISVSKRDVTEATANAVEAGLDDRVTFTYADAVNLPFEPRSFDAVLALGSMGHMPDRLRVLRQISRVLRPGGRLVLTDEVILGPPGEDQSEEDLYVQAAVAAAWCAVLPTRTEEYPELCSRVGLELDEIVDITEHTKYTDGHIYQALAAYRAEHGDLPPDMAEILSMAIDEDWTQRQDAEQTDGVIIVVAHRPTAA